MKHLLLCLVAVLAIALAANSQCNTNFKIETSQTEYLDSNKVLQRTVDEHSTMSISDSTFTLIPGDVSKQVSGKINSHSCNWTVPFKQGKSIIKATLNYPDGRNIGVTITIEGSAEKVLAYFQMDHRNDRIIRITADKFEQLKQ